MFFFENYGRFQTGNEKLKQALAFAHHLAPTLKPVLIIGEPGTGKKEMALEVISKSSRAHHRVTRWTPDIELVADNSHGTILIENLQNFTRPQQGLILKRIAASLGERSMSSPRWIVTACREILSWVRRGEILPALFQSLSEQSIALPNIVERNEDVELITQEYIMNLNEIFGAQKKLSSASASRLLNMKFEKNWSELFEKVEKAYLLSAGPLIDLKDFGFQDLQISTDWVQVGLSLSEMERRLIIQTLEMTQQNRTKAAEILGISIRTLRNKLNEYRVQEDV